MLDINAFFLIFVAAIEVISIWFVRHDVNAARKDYAEMKEQVAEMTAKKFVDEVDAYLCEKENPEDPQSLTILDAFAQRMGQAMFQAGKYSAMQTKSVDARKQTKYDNMVREGIESKMPPKLKLFQKALDYVGIDADIMDLMDTGDLPYLEKSMNKYGLGKLLSNDGRQSSEGVM